MDDSNYWSYPGSAAEDGDYGHDANEGACFCDLGFTGSDCERCPSGKYKSVYKNVACTDCPAGRYMLLAEGEIAECPPNYGDQSLSSCGNNINSNGNKYSI